MSRQQSSEEQLPAVKQALVLMITDIQDPWKITVAYFLIKELNAMGMKDKLHSTILRSLHEVGVYIAAANALECIIRGSIDPLVSCFPYQTSSYILYRCLS